jgi:hypothetical protein
MTKTLFLPEHVAQKIKADRGGASTALPAESAEDSLDKAYVDAADRVLDPALLEKPLLERLPQPTGWRVLVMPYQTAVQTRGGLFIPDEVRDRETVATVVAYVLSVGPLLTRIPTSLARTQSRGARRVTGFASAGTPALGSRLTVVRSVSSMMTK